MKTIAEQWYEIVSLANQIENDWATHYYQKDVTAKLDDGERLAGLITSLNTVLQKNKKVNQ
jgi:hypothetical protein